MRTTVVHVRIALVTESFLPSVNGVSGSVQRVCEQAARHGHDVLVLAPGPGPDEYAGARVVRTPSLPLPGYRDFPVGRPWSGLSRTLRAFSPDVVHLASPAALGAHAASAARRLDLPVLAVYQTDLAGFAARYGLVGAQDSVWRWLRRIHAGAARTLAPSRHAVAQLQAHGIERVALWARGVDLQRFSPGHRDPAIRAALAGDDEVLVGYVGRMAHEKEVDLLAGLAGLPGVRVVAVGDGPQRAALQSRLPHVRFLGHQGGSTLPRTVASLDVFVHTGSSETFCQAAQEGLASGVPLVAPAAGGLLDLVQPDRTGLLFTPGDPDDLRARVAELAADPERRALLGAAARVSVLGRSWDVLGDELMEHYAQAVRAGQGVPA